MRLTKLVVNNKNLKMKKILVYLTAAFLFISCSSKEEGEDELNDIISSDESGLSIGNEFYVFDKASYVNDSEKWFYEEEIIDCENSNELRKIWGSGSFYFYQDTIEIGEYGEALRGDGRAIFFYLTSNSPDGENGEYKGGLSLINDLYDRNFKTWAEYYENGEELDENSEGQFDCININGLVLELSIYSYNGADLNYEDTKEISIADGKFELTRNSDGTITVIIQNGIDDSLNQITFYYKGSIEEFEDYFSKSYSSIKNSFFRN
jgi:hypothetical protein